MRRWIALAVLAVLLLSAECAGAEGKKLPIDLSPGAPYKAEHERGDYELYEDSTIRAERFRYVSGIREFSCTIYYAVISIKDASQLRTYPANGTNFVKTHKESSVWMANKVNAVVAVNGDYPPMFTGSPKVSYVLRQGEVYRDTVDELLDILLIDEDGDFHVLRREEDLAGIDKTQIDGKKVINAFQFGPALVIDGKPVDDAALLDRTRSPEQANPREREQRMIICQIGRLKYMVACVARWGASLPTMRDIALYLAPTCKVAYVLDGGNSSQLVFLGGICNNVNTSNGKKRPLADIIYFASAGD